MNFKASPRIDLKENFKLIPDNYCINLPIAKIDNYKLSYEVDYFNIFIVESNKYSKESEPILLFEGKEISFSKLEERLDELTQSRDESGSNAKIVNLFIDREIKMDFVQSVKQHLQEKYLLHISYAFKYPLNNYGFYNLHFFNFYLPPPVDSTYIFVNPPFDLKEELSYFTNVINLSCYNSREFKVNDTILNDTALSIFIAQSIVADSNYIVLLNINRDQSFDEFFAMLLYSRKAIYQIRNDFSLQRYSIEFNLLNEEQQQEMRLKHPMRILEIYDEKF